MLNMKKIAGSVLVCMAALTMHAATNEDLLFYCAFDGSTTAAFARGAGAATSDWRSVAASAAPPEFQPGVRGQALMIGGTPDTTQRVYHYAPKDNIDPGKGTVSFWLKPLDWQGTNYYIHALFRASSASNYLDLIKFIHFQKFAARLGKDEGSQTAAHCTITDWIPGQWRHVAATWDAAGMQLFIDGHMLCASKIRFPIDPAAVPDRLGIGPAGWETGSHGRSLVDEFRIHRRPLSRQEVIRLYLQDAANVAAETGAAGLVTVGEKTPALDGVFGDFEYAFDGSGFSDLNGALAGRQSRYGLGYDRRNLYVAVRSELDPAKAGQPMARDGDAASSERVELFLIPQNEANAVYHFACTPDGGVADAKNGDKRWNGDQVQVKNTISSNVWTMEMAVPFAALGLPGAPDAQAWKINIARVFTAPDEATSVAPVVGVLDDRSHFMRLAFQPQAPMIQMAGLYNAGATDIFVRSEDSRSDVIGRIKTDNTEWVYGVKTWAPVLCARGKSTPYRLPWSLLGGPGAPFLLGDIQIMETRDGRETALYRGTFIHEERIPLKTLFLYTQDRKRLFVAAQQGAAGSIQARFLRPDGTCAFQASQAIPTTSIYFNAMFDLDFSKLTPGDYTVKIDYIAPDGKATETWEQEYRVPGKDAPEFRPYVDEEADKVPAPWTPLKSAKDKVEMWGRTYDFSKGFLFSSLVSQGREILAGPAALRMDGETLVPAQPAKLNKVSGSDLVAEWAKSADLGKLKVESKIKTHFDGYCEIAMMLSPAVKDQEVKTLSLDIPLRGDIAKLARGNQIFYGKNGAIGNDWCMDLGGPFFWVGNDHAGFNWLAPNLEGWHFKNNARNVEIIRTNDTAILRFNLVDTPLKLDAPRTIKFGFTLTPSRPLDRKILRMRPHKDVQMWCQVWEYFAYPVYETADRAAIGKWLKRDGLNPNEIFLYLGYELISPFCPEWAFWEEEWRSLSGARVYGEWTGRQQGRKFRNFGAYAEGCIKSDTFRRFRLHQWNEFFNKAKTPLVPKAKNYYFDVGLAGGCGNTRHGCGVGRNGLLIDEYRELALNVYRMIKRTGPDAKVWGHQGWIRAMPMQNFNDIICGGEGIEGQLNTGGGSFYDILTPEMFRASFSPYIWGIKMVFLDRFNFRDFRPKGPEARRDPEARRIILHSYGYCVVHDVDIQNENNDPLLQLEREFMQPLWAAQDTLGWDEKIEFHPYWAQDAVKLASPQSSRIMASAYTKGGKMLLAVLNDTDKEETVKLNLDLAKLGVKAGLQGADIWQPEATYTLSSNWEGKMPPRAFRLILWGAE